MKKKKGIPKKQAKRNKITCGRTPSGKGKNSKVKKLIKLAKARKLKKIKKRK
ncbi:hypothetical protein J4474_00835 [Candidatus Pacearchaeota archaeon]|nr:hypothetical protein [Candidatus Pacearchaeota archaeon]